MLARGQGATLKTELDAEGSLYIDLMRIEQAVLILVDNAAKYSADRTCVTLRALMQSGLLVVEVADEGPGIPSE